MCTVFTPTTQCPLCCHAEEDRRLIHVQDEPPVAMWALEEWAHEIDVFRRFLRDVLGLALCFVRAHTIHKWMGMQEALHGTAPCNEVLHVELGGEG